jgi:hypothetical protein
MELPTITATGTATGWNLFMEYWSNNCFYNCISINLFEIYCTLNGCPSAQGKGTVTVKPIPTLE